MNIKEVEEQSGLNRANIRYYEKEGLVTPERRENGYRDYTKDNLEELKKIRLFRELEVPIEQIKELQNSPKSLEQIMEQHITYMEQNMKHMENSITICKDIQKAGLSYNTINAEEYLNREQNTPNTAVEVNPTYQYTDVVKSTPHPWKRFFARDIDIAICILLIEFVWIVLLHRISSESTLEEYLFAFFGLLLMLFLEPLCISHFGTTPGKYIFGITISNLNGEKLTYKEAFQRTCKVLFWGRGLNIPFFNLYRLYQSRAEYLENRCTRWDFQLFDYHIPEKKSVVPALKFALFFVIYIVISGGIGIYEMTPPNKGDLTLTEYIENYNYYADYFSIKRSNKYYPYEGYHLRENGQFDPLSYKYYEFIEQPIVTFDYTLDNNYLTEISFDFEKDFVGRTFFNGFYEEMIYSTLAFTAAQEEYPLFIFEILGSFELLYWKNMAFQDYNLTFGDVDISCDVNYDESIFNLHATGSFYGMVAEGSESPYRIQFKLTK